MIDNLVDALFWSIPAIATAAVAVFLGSLDYKDKNKNRVMFTIAFGLASIGYAYWFSMEAGMSVLNLSFRWAFVPMVAAIQIAAMSGLVKLKNAARAFNVFLIVSTSSVVFMLVPTPISDSIFLLCFGTLSLVSMVALTILIARKREISNVLLFMSFSCFIFSIIAKDVGLVDESTVLLSMFASLFIGLVFTTGRTDYTDGLTSYFLQKELEKAREDLKQVQEQAHEDLEASEEKYRTLCDEGRFVMLRFDRKGTIRYVNKAIEEFGVKREDVIGSNMLKFVPSRRKLKLFTVHINVLRGNNAEGETEVITPKGIIIAEYASNPLREGGKIVGCETLLLDVTEKKQMEKKLQEYATQLEAKVEERTLDLRKSEQT